MAANKVLIANIKGPKGDPGPPGTFSEVDLARLSEVETRLDVTATKNDLTSGLGQKANADDVYSLLEAKVDADYVQNELDLKLSGLSFDGLVENTDPRLSDARQPTDHRHAQSDIDDLALVLASKMSDSQVQALISAALSALVSDAPTTLDTLGEIADKISDNGDIVDALNSAIGRKADSVATSAALSAKRDLSTVNFQTYATGSSGEQITIGYANNPGAWSIAYREAFGALRVGPASASDHAIQKSQVDTALTSKAATSHTHAQSDVTGLSPALASKLDKSAIAYRVYATGATETDMLAYAGNGATPWSLAQRSDKGEVYVGTATAAGHAVPKGQMDAAISGLYPGVVYSQTEPVVTEPTLWVQTDEAGTPVGVWTVLP